MLLAGKGPFMQRRHFVKAVGLAATMGSAFGRALAHNAGITSEADATPVSEAPNVLLIRWELERVMRADGTELTPRTPSNHTIQLLDDGRVLVQADCNSGSGTYTVDGTSLTISNMVTTLVGCEPGSIGSDFAAALATVTAYSISTDASDSLTLTTDDGAALMFNPGLTGVVWLFTRFQGGNGSEIVVDDPSRYTLEFPGDDSALVLADCNRGKGQASIDGNSIDLSVALMRAACPEGSLSTEYAAYLDEAVSWVIRDGQFHLSLRADAGIASFTPVIPPGATATPSAG
jgi:heat shock protein HslJ